MKIDYDNRSQSLVSSSVSQLQCCRGKRGNWQLAGGETDGVGECRDDFAESRQ